MDELCQPISTHQEPEATIEKVAPVVTQKSMDPSSMSFVYHWMFSVMASILSINNEKDKIQNIDNIENNNNNNSISISTDPFYKGNDENISENIQQQQQNNNCKKEMNLKNSNNNNNNQHQQTIIPLYNNNNIFTSQSPKKTLILDLDETLVHSTLKPVNNHHLTVKVLIEDVDCTFYVIKRPHVDYFIEKVSEWYDVVIFTASMQQYADPLLDQLDQNRLFKKRLFRDSCLEKDGNFIKDLTMIDQDLTSTVIIDNSPIAYSNNLENAVPIDNWMGDNPSDDSLLNLLPFLEVLRFVNDVRSILSLRLAGNGYPGHQ